MHKILCGHVFSVVLGIHLGEEYGNFNHLRELQIFFQGGSISLHSHQQYMRVFEICYCCRHQRL